MSRPFSDCIQELKVRGRPPALPAGIRIYAIGDIHARLDLLNNLLDRIKADVAQRPSSRTVYVFLGDYIDRGNASRETIDRLIEHAAEAQCVFLKGNHELIAVQCLSDPRLFDQWMRLGGAQTLISYGVRPQPGARAIAELQAAFHNALPRAHFRFFRELRNSFSCGDFFFAHAGVNPKVGLASQNEDDLLWIREQFLTSDQDFGKIVVHGHTPTRTIEVRTNRINIDTGAFATGCLTCLGIEDSSIWTIDTSDSSHRR
jgi:serine/threonine protein phosphatase 1